MSSNGFKIDNEKPKEVHIITGLGDYKKFSFAVKRLKDEKTFKEVVCIRAFYGLKSSNAKNGVETSDISNDEYGETKDISNNENSETSDISSDEYNEKNDKYMGKVVCNINKLSDEIKKLGDIGIIITPNGCRDLAKLIEKNYYNFEVIKKDGAENDVSETLIESVVEHFIGYIKDNGIKLDKDAYNIPVEDFVKEYEKCTFRVPVPKIKEGLRLMEYTKCNKNRNDYNIKFQIDGKTVSKRHISFYKNKIDEIIEKQNKTGSAKK